MADDSLCPALRQDKLIRLMDTIVPRHPFYCRKFREAGVDPASIRTLADLPRIPFTTKAELLASQERLPPYGELLTYPLTDYRRMHQTSGTSGKPLRWLDTEQSWNWLLDCWTALFRIAGVGSADRFFFPFSFGPFLGFWTAFEAATRQGWFCMAAGGMSSVARLRMLLDNAATVVLCTPTYAMRLAEVALVEGIDLRQSAVRKLIVAGEPGGNIPGTRARIENAWNAQVLDHHGMTEIGPVTMEDPNAPGSLLVLESEYLAEIIDPATGEEVAPGTLGELVLTNLGRHGSPLLRYRTGDLVCARPYNLTGDRGILRLEGGIRGRVDDMISIRGNNLHPSALQTILHRFTEVAEYRIEIDRTAALPELRIDIEPADPAGCATLPERVAKAIQDELLFRAEVRSVPAASLPRFEMKAHRVVQRMANSPATPEGILDPRNKG